MIQYDPGDGQLRTLPFTYPPYEQGGVDANGADEYSAQRYDSVTGSGLLQTVVDYVELFRTLQMTFVPDEDLPAWSAFMRYAVEGGTFNFFPDANGPPSSAILCTLADTNWRAGWNFRKIKKFTIKLRLAVSGQDAGIAPPVGSQIDAPPTVIPITAPNAGDFTFDHNLAEVPVAVLVTMQSDGLIRLQEPGWDATSIYLNASESDLVALLTIFRSTPASGGGGGGFGESGFGE